MQSCTQRVKAAPIPKKNDRQTAATPSLLSCLFNPTCFWLDLRQPPLPLLSCSPAGLLFPSLFKHPLSGQPDFGPPVTFPLPCSPCLLSFPCDALCSCAVPHHTSLSTITRLLEVMQVIISASSASSAFARPASPAPAPLVLARCPSAYSSTLWIVAYRF